MATFYADAREQTLHETCELLRATLNASSDQICVKDGALRYLAVNEAWCRHAALSREEVVGKSEEELYPSRFAIVCGQEEIAVMEAGETRRHEEWVLDGSGCQRLLETLRIPQPGGLIVIRRDVTDTRRLEAAHEQALRRLRHAGEEIQNLKAFVPICSTCKKVRDGDGSWDEVESFILRSAGAEVTHGICPDCIDQLDPLDQTG